LPFDVIAAFLRLGRKYAIKPLYTKALSRLTVAFPPSVDEYINGKIHNYIVPSSPVGCQRGGIVIDTIELARELNLPSLLPAAFWYLSVNWEKLLEDNNRHSIPEADRETILLAIKPLRVAFADYLFGWHDESVIASPGCTQPVACNSRKLQKSLKLWKPPGASLFLYSPWNPSATRGLCMSCIAVGEKHYSEGVKLLWKEMPSFFGLPPWEELLAGDV
jgi:hypothetical protein